MFEITWITAVLLKPCSCGLQIEALKSVTQSNLVTWFQAHRSSKKKVLSVHVSICQLLKHQPLITSEKDGVEEHCHLIFVVVVVCIAAPIFDISNYYSNCI